jgi:Meiosis protein SPO22/ZIP4 like
LIKTFNGSESAFKLVTHHIRKLHDKCPLLGCNALDDFMMAMRQVDRQDWVEKLVITRVWMTINQRDAVDTIEAVERVLSRVEKALSADAACAAQGVGFPWTY